ncbi:MAG: hypothetical protein CMN05_16160 [Roseibacillus sp.]|nr:hypothetical protein [Roseibacillus sp.]
MKYYALFVTILLCASNPAISGKPTPPATPRTASTVTGHRLLLGGTELGYVYLLDARGRVEWSYAVSGPVCDLAQRANGNVVYCNARGSAEITLDKRVVWEFKAPKGTEIFTCQPLPDSGVLILCNGTPPMLREFNTKTKKMIVEIEIPTTTRNVHGQFRVARKTPKGTYLLPYLSENKVCELDATGKVVRTITGIHGPFHVVALANGNILIGGGYGKQVIEVAPDDSVVWKVTNEDLPGEPFHFAAGIQRLANGNTVVANWAGHVGKAPTSQLLELTPEKKIIWKFNDWKNFTAMSNMQVLDESETGGRSYR